MSSGTELSALFCETDAFTPGLPDTDPLALQGIAPATATAVENHPQFRSKQCPDKPGFFDLPAELRIQIYKLFCAVCYEIGGIKSSDSQSPPSDSHLVPLQDLHCLSWSRYRIPFMHLQLVSHQFRGEYLEAWAEDTVFMLRPPQSCWRKHCWEDPITAFDASEHNMVDVDVFAFHTWVALRNMLASLDELAPGLSGHVRHVQVSWKCNSFHMTDLMPVVRHYSGESIARSFEPLAVHASLRLEVVLSGSARYDCVADSTPTRAFAFRPNIAKSVSRATTDWQDWVLFEEGSVMVRKTNDWRSPWPEKWWWEPAKESVRRR